VVKVSACGGFLLQSARLPGEVFSLIFPGFLKSLTQVVPKAKVHDPNGEPPNIGMEFAPSFLSNIENRLPFWSPFG